MSDGDTATPGVERARRIALNEDWAATIAGLALLILILAGVITADVIP
ncbi:hypothetical protein [Jiangella endophytica]|nr:hypothetical protein [Jiangella endophytica]